MSWIELCKMLLRYIPRSGLGRPCAASNSEYLTQINYVLRTGIQWNRLKGTLHWSTYYKKFCQWSRMGLFRSCFKIQQQILKKQGYLRQDSYKNLFIDSSMIKNIRGSDVVGINHYDRGRKGTKVSIIVTREGIPLGIHFSGSNVHDVTLVEDLIDKISVKIIGSRLIGDKGYISNRLKERLINNKGIGLIYPKKRNMRENNTELERELLRNRNIVENVFSWIQNNRRLRLRYDRYIIYYEFYYIGLMGLIDKKISY